MRRPAALIALVATLVLAVLAASGGGAAAPDAAAKSGKGARLQAFASCGNLLAYAKQHALPLVGPWGLGGGVPGVGRVCGRSAGGGQGGRDRGGGLLDDERAGGGRRRARPRQVERLHPVRRPLRPALRRRRARPQAAALPARCSCRRAGATSCFSTATGCSCSPAEACTRSTRRVSESRRPCGRYLPQSSLIEVDVSDPGGMRIVRSLALDADYVSARLVGTVARIVTVSGMPQALPFKAPRGRRRRTRRPPPAPGTAPSCGRRRSAAGFRRYKVKGRRGQTLARRPLVQCRNVRRPATYSGLGLLTVLTIDLRKGLAPIDSDSIVADGRTVYASQESLYVATQRWFAQPVTAHDVRPAQGHDRDPQVRHLRSRLDAVPGQRHRLRLPDEPVVALRAQGRAARREHRGADLVESRHAGAERELRHDARRAGRCARPARPGRRPRQGRARLRRPLHRRHRLRRHLPSGRPALHARPLDTLPAGRPRRAEDPRLLRLPAPARRRPAARDRPGRHPTRGACSARSSRSSTSRTCAVLCASTRTRSAPPGRRPRATTTPSSGGARRGWPCCRCRRTTRSRSSARSASGSAGAASTRPGGSPTRVSRHRATRAASPGIPIRRSLVVRGSLYTVSELGVKATSLASFADEGWAAFPPQSAGSGSTPPSR